MQFYGFLESYEFSQMPSFVAKYYPLGDARSYIDRGAQPRLSNQQKIYLVSSHAKLNYYMFMDYLFIRSVILERLLHSVSAYIQY